MVEVVHNVLHALALLPDEVLAGDVHVVELDEGRPRRDLARDLEAAPRDALGILERDEDHGYAPGTGALTTSANGHGGVVGHDAVGDPLLCAVDDIVLAALAHFCRRREVGDIGSSPTNSPSALLVTLSFSAHENRNLLGLRDGDACPGLAGEKIWEILVLELAVRIVQQGRDTEGHAGGDGCRGTSEASTAHL